MTSKIEEIINTLKTLTLIEAAELVTNIEKVFGVDATISSFPMNFGTEATISNKENGNSTSSKEEEKINFDVILTEITADKKIAILKIVRSITGLGLKESKDIVDNVPKTIKESISKEEAENIKKELEIAGAKVILK